MFPPHRLFGGLIGLLLILCACQPTPTPLPVNLPTIPPPTPTAGTPPPPRYAVAPDALPFLPADQINAQIVPLDAPPNPADLGVNYDLVVTLGDLPNGKISPTPLSIALTLNPSQPPLDDPALAAIVRRTIDAAQLAAALKLPAAQIVATEEAADPVTLRTELANAGYPDGFDLVVTADFDGGAQALAQLLAAVSIHARIATLGEVAHLALTTQPNTAGAIPLLTVPIHYRAAEGLQISFAPDGFPIIH